MDPTPGPPPIASRDIFHFAKYKLFNSLFQGSKWEIFVQKGLPKMSCDTLDDQLPPHCVIW